MTSGAGLGAVLVLTLVRPPAPGRSPAPRSSAPLAASLVVFGLALRGGLDSDRLVLVGVGSRHWPKR